MDRSWPGKVPWKEHSKQGISVEASFIFRSSWLLCRKWAGGCGLMTGGGNGVMQMVWTEAALEETKERMGGKGVNEEEAGGF